MKTIPATSALAQCIDEQLDRYMDTLCGQAPSELYPLVIAEAERAVIAYAMRLCDYNQSLAAETLGISRGTLRKKLALYNL